MGRNQSSSARGGRARQRPVASHETLQEDLPEAFATAPVAPGSLPQPLGRRFCIPRLEDLTTSSGYSSGTDDARGALDKAIFRRQTSLSGDRCLVGNPPIAPERSTPACQQPPRCLFW